MYTPPPPPILFGFEKEVFKWNLLQNDLLGNFSLFFNQAHFFLSDVSSFAFVKNAVR